MIEADWLNIPCRGVSDRSELWTAGKRLREENGTYGEAKRGLFQVRTDYSVLVFVVIWLKGLLRMSCCVCSLSRACERREKTGKWGKVGRRRDRERQSLL